MLCNKIFRELLSVRTVDSGDVKENNVVGVMNVQNQLDQLSLLKMDSTSGRLLP